MLVLSAAVLVLLLVLEFCLTRRGSPTARRDRIGAKAPCLAFGTRRQSNQRRNHDARRNPAGRSARVTVNRSSRAAEQSRQPARRSQAVLEETINRRRPLRLPLPD